MCQQKDHHQCNCDPIKKEKMEPINVAIHNNVNAELFRVPRCNQRGLQNATIKMIKIPTIEANKLNKAQKYRHVGLSSSKYGITRSWEGEGRWDRMTNCSDWYEQCCNHSDSDTSLVPHSEQQEDGLGSKSWEAAGIITTALGSSGCCTFPFISSLVLIRGWSGEDISKNNIKCTVAFLVKMFRLEMSWFPFPLELSALHGLFTISCSYWLSVCSIYTSITF